jgi:[protein-PII] uridylyltransferase
VTSAAHWRRTLEALGAVIAGTTSVDDLLERRRRGRPPTGVQGPPKITIDNHLSDVNTVIEVKCPDRVGLLYLITKTLSSLGLDIASARIATEIDHAYDTFYVHDRQGQKLEQPAAMEHAREGLEQALLRPL